VSIITHGLLFTSFPEKLHAKSHSFPKIFLYVILCLSLMVKPLFQLYHHIGGTINCIILWRLFLRMFLEQRKITLIFPRKQNQNNSIICKIVCLLILFIKKRRLYVYMRKGDNFDQFHMNLN
jgi:hypothetical protein